MSCFGWYDITISIKAESEQQAEDITKQFNNLDIKCRDIFIRRSGANPLTLYLERDLGEYYNSTDHELDTLAKWIHTQGYVIDGCIFAEIENEHLRGEFHDGKVQWESIEWLVYYSNEQIREIRKYATEHFK